MASIRAQFTEIQSKFDALTEEVLPDVQRYLNEALGYHRDRIDKVEASDIRLSHSDWAGAGVTVSFDPYNDGDVESFEIPFSYFDNVAKTIAESILRREDAAQREEKRRLTERRDYHERQFKLANQQLGED